MLRDIRRKEKAIKDEKRIKTILQTTKYITIAMCKENEPYLVTLSHGYDPVKNCIYFHCAKEGKKIDYLKANTIIWGEALIDRGYQQGKCDHLYTSAHFKGKVTFLENFEEKKAALLLMINQLEKHPKEVIKKQITETAIKKVAIGKIEIDYLSGKEAQQ
ncbi:MAG: hypothetical protein GF308_19220 [Candidatus Heimdallarchaeota archaeon]|nr:hypothetical protein [Candidatus Heimdallarchaeota archaeon]